MEKAVDFDKVMDLVQGSTELLAKLLETAQRDWDEQLALLEEAIKHGRTDEIEKRIHRILGSVKSFHCQALVQQLSNFEAAAHDGQSLDWAPVLVRIRLDLEGLKASLRQFLENEKE